MERKINTLNILLIIYIVIGILATAYASFLALIMSGLLTGIAVSLFVFLILVALPYYAKRALAKKNVIPCICHAVLTGLGSVIFLPLAIWQLILALQVKKLVDKENA